DRRETKYVARQLRLATNRAFRRAQRWLARPLEDAALPCLGHHAFGHLSGRVEPRRSGALATAEEQRWRAISAVERRGSGRFIHVRVRPGWQRHVRKPATPDNFRVVAPAAARYGK